jgi:hypothetical protein
VTPERLAELKARATRPRRTVPLVLNGDLRQRIEDIEGQIDAAEPAPEVNDRRLSSRRTRPDTTALEEQVAALREQAEADTLTVTLEGLPGTEWRALLAQHPARKDADGKIHPEDVLGANEETVRQPMVRACIVDLDADDVDWLMGFVTDRQMDKLVTAAIKVCRGDDAVPLPPTRSTTPTSDGA